MWGMNLTELSIIFSIWAMEYHSWPDYLIDFKPISMWILPMANAINVVITAVSWTMILPWFWFNNGWSTFEQVYWQFDAIAQHSLPLLMSTINLYLLSDMAVKYSDVWVIPFVSITYLTINYFLT